MLKEKYMNIAVKEAKKALKNGEVPIGAIIVHNDKIIAKAYNRKEKRKNVLEHAEIRAILKASKKLKNWRLNDCEMYVTLFPCPMCASAIQQARIRSVNYAVDTLDEQSLQITNQILQPSKNNVGVHEITKIENMEAKKLLQNFFKKKR